MQHFIIPKPKEENELLDILRNIGIVTHEDDFKIVLQFENRIPLTRIIKKYPELGDLIFGRTKS